MRCVDFQNEFEEQNALSEQATLHLDDCSSCQTFSYRQNRVWEMLSGLGEVKAPNDFNFGVKARIASAKSGDFQTQTGFFPALRYVMPVGFVVVLLSFLALSGLYFVDSQSKPQIANGQKESSVTKQSQEVTNNQSPINQFAENSEQIEESDELATKDIPEKSFENNTETPNIEVIAKNESEKGGSRDIINKAPVTLQPENDEGGGSTDTTVIGRGQNDVLTPEGINLNNKPKTSVNPDPNQSTDVKEILELSGIITGSEKNRLKVKAIKKNSIADSSGVKVGDIIEEINGEKITDKSFEGKTINIETITVLRKDKKIEIALKAN